MPTLLGSTQASTRASGWHPGGGPLFVCLGCHTKPASLLYTRFYIKNPKFVRRPKTQHWCTQEGVPPPQTLWSEVASLRNHMKHTKECHFSDHVKQHPKWSFSQGETTILELASHGQKNDNLLFAFAVLCDSPLTISETHEKATRKY